MEVFFDNIDKTKSKLFETVEEELLEIIGLLIKNFKFTKKHIDVTNNGKLSSNYIQNLKLLL